MTRPRLNASDAAPVCLKRGRPILQRAYRKASLVQNTRSPGAKAFGTDVALGAEMVPVDTELRSRGSSVGTLATSPGLSDTVAGSFQEFLPLQV